MSSARNHRLRDASRTLYRALGRLARGQSGTTAVEYAVMLALIIAIAILGISAFGTSSGGLYGNVNTKLGNAFSAGS